MPVILDHALLGDELVEEEVWPRLRDGYGNTVEAPTFSFRLHMGEIRKVLAPDDQVHRALVSDLELVERQGLAALVQGVRYDKLLPRLWLARLHRHLDRHRAAISGERLRHHIAVMASC